MANKLDIALAELLEHNKHLHYQDYDIWLYRVPDYSTDGNGMLLLDYEMEKKGYYLVIMNPCVLNVANGKVITFSATYCTWEQLKGVLDPAEQSELILEQSEFIFENSATGKNEPLTRALAAYKILTGKDWGEDLDDT